MLYSIYVKGQVAPGTEYDLSAWKLQTLNEKSHAFLEINSEELTDYASNFFYLDTVDKGIIFKVPSDGGTTSVNTKYPRVELRQMGDNANWPLTDISEHFLDATCKVLNLAESKPQTIIGQIHGHEKNSELLKLRWTGYQPGNCFVEARFQTNDYNGSEYGIKLATGLTLGDIINYSVRMKEGTVTVTVNEATASQTYTSVYYGTTDRYYFKAGNYIQFNEDLTSEPQIVYGINKFYKLSLSKQVTASNVKKSQAVKHQFKVYPNPAKEFIFISSVFPTDSKIVLKIFDGIGNIIKNKTFEPLKNNAHRVNLYDLEPGIYIVKLSTTQNSESFNLVIQ